MPRIIVVYGAAERAGVVEVRNRAQFKSGWPYADHGKKKCKGSSEIKNCKIKWDTIYDNTSSTARQQRRDGSTTRKSGMAVGYQRFALGGLALSASLRFLYAMVDGATPKSSSRVMSYEARMRRISRPYDMVRTSSPATTRAFKRFQNVTYLLICGPDLPSTNGELHAKTQTIAKGSIQNMRDD